MLESVEVLCVKHEIIGCAKYSLFFSYRRQVYVGLYGFLCPICSDNTDHHSLSNNICKIAPSVCIAGNSRISQQGRKERQLQ